MKNPLTLLLLFVLITLSSAAKSSTLLSETPVLTLTGAKFIAAAAAEKAQAENWNVVIVINDAGGQLKYLETMDNVMLASIEIAQQKAKSALFYKRPTAAFNERLKSGDTPLLTLPDFAAFDGGLPIVVNGKIIGAIGVSGVKPHQDAIVAQAGLDAFVKKVEQ